MPAFLSRSYLSRGDLRIFLSNCNGYAQDAVSVLYTIFASDGSQASGFRLPAIKRRTGEYYVPWIADVPNGSYRIEWEIQEDWSSPFIKKTDFFFVVDPSAYPCSQVTPANTPTPGYFTFLSGQILGPGDLPLYLKDPDGLLRDAYSVFFTIHDVSGSCISQRSSARRTGIGSYYAPWVARVGSGDYSINWEFQQDQFSPLESVKCQFSVVCPSSPFVLVEPILWYPGVCPSSSSSCYTPPIIFARAASSPYGGPSLPCSFGSPSSFSPPITPSPLPPCPPPSGSCCDYEIPRSPHLIGYLPASGGFTDQPYYVIPTGIRRVAFYIIYTRGAPGGYPVVRLMWGDGVTEVQETLLDAVAPGVEPVTAQNMYLQEMNGPVPSDGRPISFIVETRVPGGAKTVRLIAAEKGVPGSPGYINITLTAATD